MEDLFRIESPRATVRWIALSPRPTTIGTARTPPIALHPARAGDVIYPGGLPRPLFEQSEYRLVVKSRAAGARVEVRHRDPDLVREVRPADETLPGLVVGNINFRNQVGRSRFDVLVDGKIEFAFEIEVFPSKLDYREDYEQILAEVQNVLTALAFDFLKATHSGAQDREGAPTSLEWALRLRAVVEELERGLRQVARQPIRSLRRDLHSVRAERVRRPDSAVLRAARTGGGDGAWIPLEGGLRVRERLPTRRAEPTLDTQEHRWLADHLARTRRKLAQIVTDEAARVGGGTRHATALAELRAIEARLEALSRLEPLRAATAPARPGFTSLQLLGAPGYREAARSLIALQLGLRLEGNALELSLKDISTLYEYWCYLAVLDMVSQHTGTAIDARELVEVRATGLRVLLKKGRSSAVTFPLADGRKIRVEYNPRYDGHVLLSQQPDIVLAVEQPGRPTLRVVLDAKYRVDASPENQARLGIVGPPADAINVLHRYRDAILTEEPSPDEASRVARSVVHAAAVYPAAVSAEQYEDSALARQLRSIGVGAIPFLPSNRELLSRWLAELLELDGWSLGQAAQSTAYDPWVWRAAAQVVVVGGLRTKFRGSNRQHLDWCLQERAYYIDEHETAHGRHRAAAWVALYEPPALCGGDVGQVARLGRVVCSEIVDRGKLNTPWRGRKANRPVRLYCVDDWVSLPRPIPNPDHHPLLGWRWSTLLAVNRATRLAELALESPLEWALYDALKAARLEATVTAGEVEAIEMGSHRGRALFCMGDLTTLRYAGANGFELRRGMAPPVFCATVPRAIQFLRDRVSPDGE